MGNAVPDTGSGCPGISRRVDQARRFHPEARLAGSVALLLDPAAGLNRRGSRFTYAGYSGSPEPESGSRSVISGLPM